jgi:secondary thiamine-phosphate synthase enzyme
MHTLLVKTERRTQLVDVTAQVQKAVASSGVTSGVCYLYVPHTTAAVTINECADPDVARDFEAAIERLVPAHGAVPSQRREFGFACEVNPSRSQRLYAGGRG